MTVRIVIQAQAEEDILDIVRWFRLEAGARVAQDMADRIDRRIATLRNFPLSGAPRPDLGSDVRVLIERPYLIVHAATPDRVDILRVVHGARDLPAVLRGEQ